MMRPYLALRLAVLSFLLLSLGGAWLHRDLLRQAAPGEASIVLACLFLPVLPLLVTPSLMAPASGGQRDF